MGENKDKESSGKSNLTPRENPTESAPLNEDDLLQMDEDEMPDLDKEAEDALLMDDAKDEAKEEDEDVDVEMSEEEVGLPDAAIPIADEENSDANPHMTDQETETIQVEQNNGNSNSTSGVVEHEEESEAKRAIRLVEKAARDEMKFMADFDPRQSNRIQRKRVRKRYNAGDGRLVVYADDFDDCDCLRDGCPGCHLPCKHCGDHRCGIDCRVNRRFIYEAVELEGRNIEIRNTHN